MDIPVGEQPLSQEEKNRIEQIRQEKEAQVVILACDITEVPPCYARWSDLFTGGSPTPA